MAVYEDCSVSLLDGNVCHLYGKRKSFPHNAFPNNGNYRDHVSCSGDAVSVYLWKIRYRAEKK